MWTYISAPPARHGAQPWADSRSRGGHTLAIPKAELCYFDHDRGNIIARNLSIIAARLAWDRSQKRHESEFTAVIRPGHRLTDSDEECGGSGSRDRLPVVDQQFGGWSGKLHCSIIYLPLV